MQRDILLHHELCTPPYVRTWTQPSNELVWPSVAVWRIYVMCLYDLLNDIRSLDFNLFVDAFNEIVYGFHE